jgi:serine/threonine-protein kinase
MVDDEADVVRVERLLEQILESGDRPEEACRACPELLPEVRAALRQLRQLEEDVGALFPPSDAGDSAPTEFLPPEQLPTVSGYEVLGVLGHGGMGVVFRARHLRLNRPVALKMILAGPYANPDERKRFVQEAEAVAGLRHPNIVQVYDAGDIDGRPYFTMELVDCGRLSEKVNGVPQPAREAAALVATVADAVHAAHQNGIVHRDLKPSNILLCPDGTPKVTDFGLARRLEVDSEISLTGRPIGTPSYMAPEQARGDKAAIGPATDVYALGTILYELLTGRPPFRAETSSGTMQQVLHEDPEPPSRWNSGVPRDLETICLKCLQKEPGQRYATAAALAEDLRRFLRGEAIAARPAGPAKRLAKWARRRPAQAVLVLGMILTVLVLAGDAARRIRQRWLTTAAVEAELREATRLRQQAAYWGAGVALNRASARLGDRGPARLVHRVNQARRELELPLHLDAIHRERLTLIEGRWNDAVDARLDRARADREYDEAFRGAGLGGPGDDPDATAVRLRTSAVLPALVAALDDWAFCCDDGPRRAWLLRVARAADPDPWRDRAHDPAAWGDPAALADLARTAPLSQQPVSPLLALGERLQAAGEDGIDFVRRVQQAHPDDFWANLTLAVMIIRAPMDNSERVQAIPYCERALTTRPDAVAVLNNLGLLYFRRWWLDDKDDGHGPGSISIFRRALEIDPDFAPAHNNLGIALKLAKTDWGGAALHFREALRINPRLATAHLHLGECEVLMGRPDAGIDQYQQVLRIEPDWGWAHYLLGVALTAKGRYDEVDTRYPQGDQRFAGLRDFALKDAYRHYVYARTLDSHWTPAPNALQLSPRDEARLDEAIRYYREAVRLDPELDEAHGTLGQSLLARRRFAEAAAATRRALDVVIPWKNDLRANLERQRERCERMVGLQARMAAVVQGTDRPAAGDCLDLAELCYLSRHYATATRLYAEAFAADPGLSEDLDRGHRFNAACAAASAGCGRGSDVDGLGEPGRRALRARAREYLRLDLAAWTKKLDGGSLSDRLQAQTMLPLWRRSADLAGLRDADPLEELPPAERQECRALWQAFSDLLRRAETPG